MFGVIETKVLNY